MSDKKDWTGDSHYAIASDIAIDSVKIVDMLGDKLDDEEE